MMEPHASIAVWEGDELTLLDVKPDDRLVALGPRDHAWMSTRRRSTLMSPFIGGGFGGKLFLRADAVLAAFGAQRQPSGR
jgi:xanthine dehydrogenase YagR molybdenum-binding subunit